MLGRPKRTRQAEGRPERRAGRPTSSHPSQRKGTDLTQRLSTHIRTGWRWVKNRLPIWVNFRVLTTAIEALFIVSQGIMRRIDTLAHNALAVAATRKAQIVDADHVLQAAQEIRS